MNTSASGVLKKHMIRQGQPCRIGGGAGGGAAAPPASQARIVEQTDGRAVVELTCSCGNKIYLNCDYDHNAQQGDD